MKKVKKLAHVFLWKLFKLVPTRLKHALIRSQIYIELPEGVYADIEYKIAQTPKEIEQALALVQNSYLASKLTSDDSNLYRISKFNLLPTTTIFIAKYKGEVIATVSQVMDTSLGLPIESFTHIDFLRNSGARISEISGLAVKKDWRSRSTGVFFPLTSYAVKYCEENLGVDYAVMVTRSSARHFYSALYGFKSIDKKSKNYDVVNGKNSFAQYLNLNTFVKEMKKTYKNKPLRKNVYQLYYQFPWRHLCDFSKREYNVISRLHFNSDELAHLISSNKNINQNFTADDKRNLASIYFYKNMVQVFSNEEYHYVSRRRFPRFQVNMQLQASDECFKLIEVSQGGFCMIGDYSKAEISGMVVFNSKNSIPLKAKKCWEHNGRVGFQFEDMTDQRWMEMIKFSENVFGQRLKSERSAA